MMASERLKFLNGMRITAIVWLGVVLVLVGCQVNKQSGTREGSTANTRSEASIGILGDTSNVDTETESGFIVMGGGPDVDEAMKWMIERSGGGDFVIVRATGTDAYNPYIDGLGEVNSVETLKIDTYSLALDSSVAETIYEAEAIFMAGGDQSDYVDLWMGTNVGDAINYLINEKKVPVGGTSAGAAIMGGFGFSAMKGTITSEEALQNPYHENIMFYKDDFLDISELKNTIVDQHYIERNRQGRHITFMASLAYENPKTVRGIGVDEETAVAINAEGKARVLGKSKALFLEEVNPNIDPEVFEFNVPLTWNNNGKAVHGYEISSRSDDQLQFDLVDWRPLADENAFFYYVKEGALLRSDE